MGDVKDGGCVGNVRDVEDPRDVGDMGNVGYLRDVEDGRDVGVVVVVEDVGHLKFWQFNELMLQLHQVLLTESGDAICMGGTQKWWYFTLDFIFWFADIMIEFSIFSQ